MKLTFMAKERQIALDTMKSCRKQLLSHIEKVLQEGLSSQFYLHHIKEINNNFLKPVVSLRPKVWEAIKDPYDIYQHLINNDDIEKIVDKLAKKNPKYNDRIGWSLIGGVVPELVRQLWNTKKVPTNEWWTVHLKQYFEYVGV